MLLSTHTDISYLVVQAQSSYRTSEVFDTTDASDLKKNMACAMANDIGNYFGWGVFFS